MFSACLNVFFFFFSSATRYDFEKSLKKIFLPIVGFSIPCSMLGWNIFLHHHKFKKIFRLSLMGPLCILAVKNECTALQHHDDRIHKPKRYSPIRPAVPVKSNNEIDECSRDF